MIKSLKIHQLIHFDDIEIEFDSGLTVITGESGTGKSIIIQSLQTLAGKSIPQSWMTQKEKSGYIEGTFELKNPSPQFEDYLDEGHWIVVRRYLSEGKSTLAQINGQNITLKTLKQLISPLISTTTQHQQLSLADSEQLIAMLDSKINWKFEHQFKELLIQKNEISNQLQAFQQGHSSEQHQAFLEFQINDLESLHLQPNEDEILKTKKERIQKHDKEAQIIQNLKSYTSQIEESVDVAQKQITALTSYPQITPQIQSDLHDINLQIESINQSIQRIESDVSALELEDIDSIESRLDTLFRAKAKYGVNHSDELISRLQTLQSEHFNYKNSAEHRLHLENQRDSIQEKLSQMGQELSMQRNNIAQSLNPLIQKTALSIGFPFLSFDLTVRFSAESLNTMAGSIAEIRLSTNPNKPPQSIEKIASGGELSRLFLSIISNLDVTNQQALVFDEVDAGIGGNIANQVGALINQLSNTRQIICITHLPQIAKFAKTHYVVSKHLVQSEIMGQIVRLSEDSRSQELMRMIGGNDVLSHIAPHSI